MGYKKNIKHSCSLDCWDCCSFDVTVEDGVVTKIEGDKTHPYTKGVICIKGKKHLERLYSGKRLKSPLLKTDRGFKEISFNQAVDIMAQKLSQCRDDYGSLSVMHFSQSGAGGVCKSIEDIFFNFYGGTTKSKGSTCWGAGIQAQKCDFGDVKSHSLDDIVNSNLVVLWGRNPHSTSVHLMAAVQNAMKSGAKVVTIDPIRSETAKRSDIHIQAQPSSDLALALSMTIFVLKNGLEDRKFIQNHSVGFENYRDYLFGLDVEELVSHTGLSLLEVENLAIMFANARPAAVYPGYGLQKYKNGVNTIRAIDCLCAICGYVGVSGGGVSYANRVYPGVLELDPFASASHVAYEREFMLRDFSHAITSLSDPPVKMLVVSKANPMNQLPDLTKAQSAFSKVEFTVTFDMFMTDTAALSDLVIPCTNTLESDDIIYSSMNNPYISFSQKAVEPFDILMDEYYFFQELAKEMGMDNYPLVGKLEYLEKVVEPLKEYGYTFDDIKNGHVTIQPPEAPWRDMKFKTPSGKFEFVSSTAKIAGLCPHPEFIPPEKGCGLRLITPHAKNSLFSQHFFDKSAPSHAYVNQKTADSKGISDCETAVIYSENGHITVKIAVSPDIPDGVVSMDIGWHKIHGNPNFLTSSASSENGEQLAYYETFVDVKKV
ncbi:Anaerobic selenocysteine-containing dehydrogenase [Peptoclostridium litorale DSM 5388]|uniref:Putative oxidoreductase subunit n=1 Tax=Peptoclostridium litorale DSM 5388 TaxID=1121324 RepID=A0A069RFC3_PEPLI|nr:molybdopterin-dependent oxidoreductase [Peptoclostridium litorale]KDR95701.1 putative oxidoreductase subunit [Peptoclostridium litorale DSM 5388]SIO01432.1 Anaerobic selenocysteine-containing dehydrogenase [Peptoclostridium litorale DSM 5388]